MCIFYPFFYLLIDEINLLIIISVIQVIKIESYQFEDFYA